MAVLLVEGQFDARVVKRVLGQIGLDALAIVSTGGAHAMRPSMEALRREGNAVAALVDAEGETVPDAIEHWRGVLGMPEADPLRPDLFVAMQSVEAWLLADHAVVERFGRHGVEGIAHWPLADEIPKPSRLAAEIFGPGYKRHDVLLDAYDLSRALSNSPSLQNFVDGISLFVSGSRLSPVQTTDPALRRAIVSAIRQVAPSDQVMWKTTSSGRFTAEDLIELLNGSERLGDEYATEILDVAVDLLGRRARRGDS